MLNEILILVLFLFILNNKNKICEGTMNSNNRELCSNHPGLKSFMFNENCGDSNRHKVIENCLGSGDSISAGLTAVKAVPCKLCNNLTYGQCKPTLKGGDCEKNGEKTDADGHKLPRNKIGRDIFLNLKIRSRITICLMLPYLLWTLKLLQPSYYIARQTYGLNLPMR